MVLNINCSHIIVAIANNSDIVSGEQQTKLLSYIIKKLLTFILTGLKNIHV